MIIYFFLNVECTELFALNRPLCQLEIAFRDMLILLTTKGGRHLLLCRKTNISFVYILPGNFLRVH